ncbi:MAG: sigma-70 family RNA polymerase sigma factor [Deltaproteobacteria bacterium]|nr:sigma-70 family RNA polymerase sigma factor [Deltaproteobacteria bacterium]
MNDDALTFEDHRPALLGLAYRMLGSMGEAEDVVQDAWIRWQGRRVAVDAPRAYLMRTVTNLCLNTLDSARVRLQHHPGSRLPEPVHTDDGDGRAVERSEAVSMALLVALQQLSAAERAVLVLHQVFEIPHAEIAAILGRSAAGCRQLLRRARAHLRHDHTVQTPSRDEHARLLQAFVQATTTGTVDDLVALLAEEAQLLADAGPEGATYGPVRNLPGPLQGARKVAAFLHAATGRAPTDTQIEVRELNGLPALVSSRNDEVIGVLLLDVHDGRIRRVFIQADRQRLRRLASPRHLEA